MDTRTHDGACYESICPKCKHNQEVVYHDAEHEHVILTEACGLYGKIDRTILRCNAFAKRDN